MKINNNIELQTDSTGQNNRLVGKFIEILFESDNINIKFKISIIHDYCLDFKKDISNIIYKEFNYSLYDIYERLQELPQDELNNIINTSIKSHVS